MTGNKSYKREQVVRIINSVLGKIKSPQESTHEFLMHELTELKSIIDNLREQLNAVQAGDISRHHIPAAADELDAVVSATENATVVIMESCENILDTMRNENKDLYGRIEMHIVKIFEACTFQDVTGQRIKKVTQSLRQIDIKTSSILKAIESELVELEHSGAPESSNSLLNGPALPQNAVSQDAIDQLLAEFDK